MKKTYLRYTVSFLSTLITACSGGGAYVPGTLDGTWDTGREGGANGNNWSYKNSMTISGNSVVQNTSGFRQNQTCSGTADVAEVISFTMAWGTYDTTGYSDNATYSNFSWLVTKVTSNGLASTSTFGSCAADSFTQNVASQCRTSTTGSYKYYLADNTFLPVSQGLSSGAVGISYAFETYRKVVSNPSAVDGI